MDPAEQLTQISKLVEPHLARWGRSEIGDLARSIRDIIDDKSWPRVRAGAVE
ncbi:Uncharacterised protein [Mycobacteroides abscessus subsp. bolletii]|nr:Uncharacterised protein [Mycobacteroides abscessus]SKF61086.1 Uncharacterised protein [Mycobacteroides abscessus subsp. bolletii]SKH64499.1 Uncharacterised protein [Mycobacteroides abscessus subsp. bolletii]